jgi:hypothetical protein
LSKVPFSRGVFILKKCVNFPLLSDIIGTGGDRMKFRVVFYFSKDDYDSAVIEGNSKEELKKEILEATGWYEYKNEKGNVDYAIQMARVNSITISEYQKPNARFMGVN